MEAKNKNIILLVCVLGGLIGLHYFYIGDIKRGCIYLFTGGLFGIGWVYDIIKIVSGNFETVEDVKNEKIEDEKWKQLAYNFYMSEEYKKLKVNNKEIDFSSIMNVELMEDGTSASITTGTNKTKGKSKKHIAPVKGVVGGVLFGPVGAIIGGTSGKTDVKTKTDVNTITKNIDYCTDLSIKITVNDMNNPMIIYKLINSKVKKDSFTYRNSYEKAQKCISTIQVIINNN